MLPVDKAAFAFSTYTQLCYIGLKNQTKILNYRVVLSLGLESTEVFLVLTQIFF